MSSLARRVAALEAVAPASESGRRAELQRAARALFDALERIYPSEPWRAGAVRRDCGARIVDAARRLEAGELTVHEREALRGLPAEALTAFGVTPEEALTLVARAC
jgi:hypothetical protein